VIKTIIGYAFPVPGSKPDTAATTLRNPFREQNTGFRPNGSSF
jgi:hypothetical protein